MPWAMPVRSKSGWLYWTSHGAQPAPCMKAAHSQHRPELHCIPPDIRNWGCSCNNAVLPVSSKSPGSWLISHCDLKGIAAQILLGQTQALKIARTGLQLNVNLLPGAFRRAGDVASLVREALGREAGALGHALDFRQKKAVEKAVKGLKVGCWFGSDVGISRRRQACLCAKACFWQRTA